MSGRRDVSQVKIDLKTNPKTTFYAVDNPRYGATGEATDQVGKVLSYKPRRKKVRGSYKVPGEAHNGPDFATWQEHVGDLTKASQWTRGYDSDSDSDSYQMFNTDFVAGDAMLHRKVRVDMPKSNHQSFSR